MKNKIKMPVLGIAMAATFAVGSAAKIEKSLINNLHKENDSKIIKSEVSLGLTAATYFMDSGSARRGVEYLSNAAAGASTGFFGLSFFAGPAAAVTGTISGVYGL